jgi:hypothetical protein
MDNAEGRIVGIGHGSLLRRCSDASVIEQEAARSLCALGLDRSRSISPDEDDANKKSSRHVATAAHDRTDPVSSSEHFIATIWQINQTSLEPMPAQTAFFSPATGQTTMTAISATWAINNAPPKKAPPPPSKHVAKSKDPSRDTSVPFDEMKRLMRVYGSLKCLRNRLPVDSGKAAKAESIKRKFYRWFPDLEERFVRTEEGWYVPKAGHEEEMRYRELMRRGDQDCLVRKRTAKRFSTKNNGRRAV